MFAWFAKEADQVFVFDNSSTRPVIAAFKNQGVWKMRKLSLLAADLASRIRALVKSS